MVPLPIVGGPRWAGFLEAGLTGQPRWSSLEPRGAQVSPQCSQASFHSIPRAPGTDGTTRACRSPRLQR